MKRDYLRRRLIPLLVVFTGGIGVALALVFLLPARWPEGAILVPRDVPTLREALERVEPGGTIVLQAGKGPFRGPVAVDTAGVNIRSTGEARLEGEGGEPAIFRREGGGVDGEGSGDWGERRRLGLQVGSHLDRFDPCRPSDRRILRGGLLPDPRQGSLRIVGSSAGDYSRIRVKGGDIALQVSSCIGGTFRGIEIDSPGESGIVIADSRVSGGRFGVSLEGSDDNDLSSVAIEGSTEIGIRIVSSNENRLTDSAISLTPIGIMIENAQGNVVGDCRIEGADTGCLLRRAVQNGMTRMALEDVGGIGIHLVESSENAISYNRLSRIGEVGIRLEGSERSLILANAVESGKEGILSEGSSGGRILRNAVSGMEEGGILVIDGENDRLLDNVIPRGRIGIAVVGSPGETILRNRIADQDEIGIALLNGSDDSALSENSLHRNGVGILLASSAYANVSENDLLRNSTGILLCRPGPATRIERNRFVSNGVGLAQEGTFNPVEMALGRLGLEPVMGCDGASPIIVNNVFDRNIEFDVKNNGDSPLYVAGNWWGGTAGGRTPQDAILSAGVLLPDSGWRGKVALGTGTGIVERILGEIVLRLLIEAGYQVIDLIGLGDGDEVKEALQDGDVDIVWLVEATPFEEGAWGSFSSAVIPAEERPIAVVSKGLADRLAEPILSALPEEGDLVIAAPRSLSEGAEGLVEAYGISPARGGIQWAEALEEVEALLKFGAADVAIVPSLEESLTLSGFVALTDDRSVGKGEAIAILFRADLVECHPDLEGIIADLTPRLTGAALHRLVSRVRLFGETPAEAADDFFEKGGYVE